MLLIEIKGFEDEIGDEQRTGIIEAVTDTMVSLTEESIRPHPPTPRLHRAPAGGPDDGDVSDERRLSTTPATSLTFEQTNGFSRALR